MNNNEDYRTTAIDTAKQYVHRFTSYEAALELRGIVINPDETKDSQRQRLLAHMFEHPAWRAEGVS